MRLPINLSFSTERRAKAESNRRPSACLLTSSSLSLDKLAHSSREVIRNYMQGPELWASVYSTRDASVIYRWANALPVSQMSISVYSQSIISPWQCPTNLADKCYNVISTTERTLSQSDVWAPRTAIYTNLSTSQVSIPNQSQSSPVYLLLIRCTQQCACRVR